MKRSVSATSCIVLTGMVLFLAGCQTTGLKESLKPISSAIDIFNPNKQKSGNFKADAKRYSKFLALGTYNLLQALSNMQEAVGNKELAEQILLQANDLKAKSDKGEATDDDYKKAFKTIDESSVDREQLSKVPTNRGRIYLTKSFINVGLGTASDTKAVDLGISLIKNTSLKGMWKNGDFFVGWDLMELSANTLPTHIKRAAVWSSELHQYMQDNDIEIPTEQEQRIEAEQQGADQDEIDDIFA